MKVIRVEDYECTIEVGYQGENLARCIEWDLSKWVELYGEGTPTLLIMRADDTAAYPVATEYTDNILRWCPTAADTAQMGIGEAQIIYTVDDVIAKKRIMSTEVLESLDNEVDPPDPWQGWVDEVIQAKDDAESARDDAQAAQSAAESAQAGAESAQESAEVARDLAEGYRDQAQTAQGAAESAKIAAQTAQAAAESAQSAAETAQGAAEDAANLAEAAMEDAEAWVTGERGGTPVTPGDPTYHNNSKYYSEQSSDSASSAVLAESGAQAAQSAAEIAQAAAEAAATAAQTALLSAFATEGENAVTRFRTKLGADAIPTKTALITQTAGDVPMDWTLRRCGKNQFDAASVLWKKGYNISASGAETVQSSYAYTLPLIPVIPGARYVASGFRDRDTDVSLLSNTYCTMCYYDQTGTFRARNGSYGANQNPVFTTPSIAAGDEYDCCFVRFYCSVGLIGDDNKVTSRVNVSGTNYNVEIQFEIIDNPSATAADATAYEPYAGVDYVVPVVALDTPTTPTETVTTALGENVFSLFPTNLPAFGSSFSAAATMDIAARLDPTLIYEQLKTAIVAANA